MPDSSEQGLSEIRRRLDYQVSVTQRYQDKSFDLLRFTLTLLAVLIAILSVIISEEVISQFNVATPRQNVDRLVEFWFLNEPISILLVMVSIVAIFGFLVDVGRRVIIGLSSAWHSIELDYPEAGVEVDSLDVETSSYEELYLEIAKSNEEIVGEARELFKRCHRNLSLAVVEVIGGFAILLSLLQGDPRLVLATSVGGLFIAGFWIYELSQKEFVKSHLIFVRMADIPSLIVLFVVIVFVAGDLAIIDNMFVTNFAHGIYGIILLISLLLVLRVGYLIEHYPVGVLISRAYFILVIGFPIAIIGTLPFRTTIQLIFGIMGLSVMMAAMLVGSTLLIGRVARLAHDTVGILVLKLQEQMNID